MGDSVTIARIWSVPSAYRKFSRLDEKGKRFVLKKLSDKKVAEKDVMEAIKEWKKKRKKS